MRSQYLNIHICHPQWFQGIIANHPSEENADDLIDINDICNGMFIVSTIHEWFDPQELVICKVCCLAIAWFILTSTMMPRPQTAILTELTSHVRMDPLICPPGVVYPRGVRYALQWLGKPDEFMCDTPPKNIDVTFAQSTRRRKPSGLLLHYNCGAAALKHWGHGVGYYR